MTRTWIGTALAFFLFFSVDCGKKGPLVLPLVKAPQKIETFALAQRGDKAILEWTNPAAYLDGSPLSEIGAVDIWLLVEEKPASGTFQKLVPDIFEKQAKLAISLKNKELSGCRKNTDESSQDFVYRHTLNPGQMAGQRLTFGMKVKDKKEKESDFSKLLSIETKALPGAPQNVKVTAFEDRLEVRWDPPSAGTGKVIEKIPATPPEKSTEKMEPVSSSGIAGYNIYRSEGQGGAVLLNSTIVTETKYDDKEFAFGQPYRYFVRASVTASSPYQESEDSETAEVIPKDIFPPAAPSGLLPVAGNDFIALSWEANREKDLAGYYLWRKTEGEAEFALLTPQPISESSYTDRAVEKGKVYTYAISVRDLSGNESPKSEPVSEIVKEKNP